MKEKVGELEKVAYDVADEHRSGLLSHLNCPKWALTWEHLLKEVERRCPGFTSNEYNRALNDGFFASR